MSDDDVGGLPRFAEPAWRDGLAAWVDECLRRTGARADLSRVTVRSRPWATVWRVPTSAGAVWCKASARGTAYEAALVAVLAQWAPGHVLEPLGVDEERGWLLLPDGGRTLRETQGSTPDLAAWERMLTGYAGLQRSLEGRVDELLGLGVPDMRPEVLPEVHADLLADGAALMTGDADGMTAEEHAQHRAASAAFGQLCDELAAVGVRPTLQHDDLHDGNVFVADDGSHRVFDWGDAVVAHPFATLLVTLRVLAAAAGLGPGAAELLRLRDAYLEAWSDEHDTADLRRAAGLALRVTPVARAASWRRALAEASGPARAPWGDGVPGWLGQLFEPHPLDAAGWPAR